MNRRSFLRGTLLSTAGATGLIQFASSAESKLLVPKREIIIGHPEQEVPFLGDSPEVYMRRNDGGFQCIGIVTQVTVHTPMLEYTSWEGTVQMYDPGIRRGTIYFEGRG